MEAFKFIENPQLYTVTDSFTAHIPEILSEDQLFNELYDQLKFPDYFGFNWNALLDCLSDFCWIEESKIVLIHDSFINLDSESFKIYIEILFRAIQNWNDDKHSLNVVFPLLQQKQINQIVDNYKYAIILMQQQK